MSSEDERKQMHLRLFKAIGCDQEFITEMRWCRWREAEPKSPTWATLSEDSTAEVDSAAFFHHCDAEEPISKLARRVSKAEMHYASSDSGQGMRGDLIMLHQVP